MFGGFGSAAVGPPPIGHEEWSDAEMLAYEKATLGFYITKHPLAQYEELVRRFSTTDTAGLVRLSDGAQVVLGGLVSRVRSVPIRTGRSVGKKLLVATLEDFAGSTDVIVFPDRLEEARATLKPDAVVFVEGAADRRREEPSVRAARVIPIDRAAREYAREVLIRLGSAGGSPETLPQIAELCRAHRGACPVYLEVALPDGSVATIKGRASAQVDPTESFLRGVGKTPGVQQVLCCGARGAVSQS
jgi:DNA polymerase-3 subunit alpha